MKYTITNLILIVFSLLLTACNFGMNNTDEGGAYEIVAKFEVTNPTLLENMVLYTDTHTKLLADSIVLSQDLSFTHTGYASGINELYLCSDGGELCRFYVAEGMTIDLSLKNEGDSLIVNFDSSKQDSINSWLQNQLDLVDSMTKSASHDYLDSLCHQHPSDIRTTLLIRENIDFERDSVFVRRCLGALTDEAKPSWLTKSIDRLLGQTSDFQIRSRRLEGCKLQLDSTEFDLSASRSDYLLIYFWADYSQASIDSLSIMDDLVNTDYDMKRLTLLSCCLSAPDSLWWKEKIKNIEGNHVRLPAGFSDKRVFSWHMSQVPGLILCDMYNNQQQRNVWGSKLRQALDRVPNRSGFNHTNTKKSNGRPNNLSRPSRH